MDITVYRSLRLCWMFLMVGILLIVASIYLIASPAAIYLALGFMFGLIILLTGIAELFQAVSNPATGKWEWHLMLGIVDVILGILLVGEVAAGVTILRIVAGIWFLLKAISLFNFSSLRGGSGKLITAGVLTVIFALLILLSPKFGHLTIMLWTAVAFIRIFNILLEF